MRRGRGGKRSERGKLVGEKHHGEKRAKKLARNEVTTPLEEGKLFWTGEEGES
jgi:hypothetical protein